MAPPSDQNITLYRGWLDTGKHVWSPFVVKLEARLRFAGVTYKTDIGNPRVAPRGKIPYVDLSGPRYEGVIKAIDPGNRTGTAQLADSTFIIRSLTETGALPDLNARLTPEEKATDLALRALLEEKLYFYHGFERWIQNYYTMRDHALWSVPYPMRVIVGLIISRNMTATLYGQGTGRLTPEEISTLRAEIWHTINGMLLASRSKSQPADVNREPFWALGGDEPTEADACLFGFIVSVLLCTAGPDSQKVVKGYTAILDYADRVHSKYFPDYEKWTL
ncbi:hypothetical protein F4778DRAFT_721137 [Xylariomycetidae sp. FL2044]|nr:hypothetical protein F4778DRAFT_721137 [Xylariomycetidae sp. FL2044]